MMYWIPVLWAALFISGLLASEKNSGKLLIASVPFAWLTIYHFNLMGWMS
jgi:hypothetical protein